MKIAIVRGPSLNPWEMQNYLPLAKKHQLLLVGSKNTRFLPAGRHGKVQRGFKVEKLICLGEIFNRIPGGIKLLYHLFGDPQPLLGLEKTIAGFDIVHTAETANYYSLQAIRARQKGLVAKVGVTCWENIPFAREDYPASRELKEKVRSEADHFLAVTEGAKRALMKEGVAEERITVIPMGVDIKKFKSKFKVKDELKILFVGRLEEEKGVWEILEAFKTLRSDYKDIKLIVVGQGTEAGKIKDWLKGSNLLRWVQLRGAVDHEKIWSEYHQSDIFVLPSKPTPTWQEQFGMVLIEAMASGLPIVATKSGAIPEVVGKAGILVEPGNIRELTDAMGGLLKDGKLREELGSRGLKRAKEKYDSLKVAEKIEGLYQKLLKE